MTRERGSWLLLTLSVGILCAHALYFDFINDDAFISFRYAENLVDHGELTFNRGERVEGYTNFLWTLLMGAVILVGGDPVPWSKALGLVCSCLTLLCVFAFSRWWFSRALTEEERNRRSPLWTGAACLYLAMNPSFAAWSEGGLETGLYTLLVTAGVIRSIVEWDQDTAPWSGVILALAAMTRPEGLLVFGLLALARTVIAVRIERIPVRTGIAVRIERILWKRFVRWIVVFLVLFVPYWIWRFVYYGYPLPNTFYAKSGQVFWQAGLKYVYGFAQTYQVWLLIPLLLIPWRSASRSSRLLSPALFVTLPYFLLVILVGGDFMGLYRFLVPLLPLLALLAQEGMANLWGLLRLSDDPRIEEQPRALRTARGPVGADEFDTRGETSRTTTGRRKQWRPTLIVAGLLSALVVHHADLTRDALRVHTTGGINSIGWLKQFVEQATSIGMFLKAEYPPDASIATTAAGAIPFYSKMRTLDMHGLSDLYTAHNVRAYGGRTGHAKSPPEDYVLRWAPTVMIGHPRMHSSPEEPPAGEARYWLDRGYRMVVRAVPDLEPSYLTYWERIVRSLSTRP